MEKLRDGEAMKHLGDDALAQWLSGEASVEEQAHMDECARCKAEAMALGDGISRYRLALRRQASERMHARPLRVSGALATRRLGWAGVALAVALAAPAAWMMRPHVVPAGQSSAVTQTGPQLGSQMGSQVRMSDDELLDAVGRDLDRDVPQALAPVSAITVARNQMAASTVDLNTKASDTNNQTQTK
jgi:hypothetical protein